MRPRLAGRHRAGRRAAAGVPQGDRARERLPAAPALRGSERGRDPDPLRPRGPAPGRGRDARRDARGRRRGLPGDVLRRRAGAARPTSCCAPTSRSDLGGWSYDIADTKLARRLKVAGAAADGDVRRAADRAAGRPAAAAHRRDRRRGRAALAAGRRRVLRAAGPGPAAAGGRGRRRRPTRLRSPHCSQCRWSAHCTTRWEQADDLSLVAGMRSGHRHALIAAGLPTVEALAAAAVTELPRTIGRPSRERLAQQARLQVSERTTGQAAYELLPTRSPTAGCCACRRRATATSTSTSRATRSPPTAQGREYLAGLWDRSGRFTHLVGARPRRRRRQLTRDLLDELTRRLAADPGMHVYHYAAYEQTALKRLTGRHGIRETELDALLRGERFVDLYRRRAAGAADQQAVVLDQEARGLLLGAHPHRRRRGVADAMSSVVEYERFLVDGDAAVLDVDRQATTATTCARPTTCTPGWSSGGPSSRSEHGTQPRPAARDGVGQRGPVRRRGGRGRAGRPAQGRRAPAAGRRRRVAPARGAPEVVGHLPAQGPRRRGAAGRRRPRSAGCPRRSTTATSSSPSGGATSSRSQDTKVERRPAQAAGRRHRRPRSARSSRWTPPPGGWC